VKFEYRSESLARYQEPKWLNQLGNEGWEVVSAWPWSQTEIGMLLKRVIPKPLGRPKSVNKSDK
jgi:hypothetical protein